MDNPIADYLQSLYFDPAFPASFSGIDKFYKSVKEVSPHKISRETVRKWLNSIEEFSIQRPARKIFKRRKIIAPQIGYLGEADTANMVRYSEFNDGYAYFLGVIDAMSKKAYTEKLKTLEGPEVAAAFDKILSRVKFKHIRTDNGQDMTCNEVKAVYKKHNVKHYTTGNQLNASIIERFFKTFKSKLVRKMTITNNFEWAKYLESLTKNYNKTFHRSIKMKPDEVRPEHEVLLWQRLYEQSPSKKSPPKKPPSEKNPFKFDINDTVRIQVNRQAFLREYDPKWTSEYYLISHRFLTENLAIYKLKDIQNEPIKSSFQQFELLKADIPNDATYRIDKIIKTKGRGQHKMALVSWVGWHHKKFRTWIKYNDIINYQDSS